MARVKLQKIRVVGLKRHAKILLQELHKRGVMEITENKSFEKNSAKTTLDLDLHKELFGSFDLARIDFAISFLKNYAPKTSKIESILNGGMVVIPEKEARDRFEAFVPHLDGFVTECEKLEETLVRGKNEVRDRLNDEKSIEIYADYPYAVGKNLETEFTQTLLVKLPLKKKAAFCGKISEKSNLFAVEVLTEAAKDCLLLLTVDKTLEKTMSDLLVDFGGEKIDLQALFADFADKNPREIIELFEEEIIATQDAIMSAELRRIELAKEIAEVQIAYDFFTWRHAKNQAQSKTLRTQTIFAFDGWIPAKVFGELGHWLQQVFVGDVVVEKIEPLENEEEPALLKNKKGFSSFQMITEMFGAPTKDDLDPTAFMTPFFIIFFGICLSDVGYGLLLALTSGLLLQFGRFGQAAKEKTLMIFLCGMSAMLGGVLLGGWFGMTTAQLSFMVNPATGNFYGQVLDPLAGNGAMVFLGVSFGLGLIQLLFGVALDGLKRIQKKDYFGAFADSFSWILLIVSIVLWALAADLELDKQFWYYGMLAGVGILVLTQGRDKKNIFAKLLFGILGLYGIIDYLSNVLSYSRLMALGLSTGIIGAAMNTTALVLYDLIPVPAIGVLVAIGFILFGHSLNFALSLLGAFIHTMRLQFIEFFGRFYTGGAPMFQAFGRQNRYLEFLKK